METQQNATLTERRINLFTQKAGKNAAAYQDFLVLVAQPLLFSTDFLYKLWLNFKAYKEKDPKKQPSYLVVSDFILSGLCQPIGTDLFRMEEEIREHLLSKTTKEIRQDVALFIEEYALRNKSNLSKNIFEIHSLFAEGILRPKEMEKKIIEKLNSKANPNEKGNYINLYLNSLPFDGNGNQKAGISFMTTDNPNGENVLKLGYLPKGIEENLDKEDEIINLKNYSEVNINDKGQKSYSITSNNEDTKSINIFESAIKDISISSNVKEINIHDSTINTLIIENIEIKEINISNCTINSIEIYKVDIKYFNVLDLKLNDIYFENTFINEPIFKKIKIKKGYFINIPLNVYNFLFEINDFSVLFFEQNSLEDIRPLTRFKNLVELSISKNRISDISILSELANLTQLYLNDNEILDISVLAELIKIHTFQAANNQISDISALSNLKGLSYLNLSGNKISDIYPISKCIELSYLYLENNLISDISFLAELKQLEKLVLDNNQISDIYPILELPNLRELYLKGNPIENIPKEIYDIDGNCLERVREYLQQEIKSSFRYVLEQGYETFNVAGSNETRDTQEEVHRIIANATKSLENANYSRYFNEIDKLIIDEFEEDYFLIKKEFTTNSLSENFNQKLKDFKEHAEWRLISKIEDRMGRNALIELDRMYEEKEILINKAIENNLASKNTSLDLSNQGIEDGDDLSKLLDCEHLEILNLENNSLTKIPQILGLPNLKELYLKGNYINIPKEIYDFDGNCLEGVREYFENNKSTEQTQFSQQQEQEQFFPSFNSTINKLEYCIENKTPILDLSNSNIKDINSEISQLFECKHLEVLNLEDNEITHFPLDLLEKLPNLKELYLKGNPIENIPTESYNSDRNCLNEMIEYYKDVNLNFELNTITKALWYLDRTNYAGYFEEVDKIEMSNQQKNLYNLLKANLINVKTTFEFNESLREFALQLKEPKVKNQKFLELLDESTSSEISTLLFVITQQYEKIPSHKKATFNQLKSEFENSPNDFQLRVWKTRLKVFISGLDFEIEYPLQNSNWSKKMYIIENEIESLTNTIGLLLEKRESLKHGITIGNKKDINDRELKTCYRKIQEIKEELHFHFPSSLLNEKPLKGNILELEILEKKIKNSINKNTKPSVFISYNHNNIDLAKKIKEYLEKNNIDVIIDFENMKAGDDVKTFVERSIKKSNFVLALISRSSLFSTWVAMENVPIGTDGKIKNNKTLIALCEDDFLYDDNFLSEDLVKITEEKEKIEKELFEDKPKKMSLEEFKEYNSYKEFVYNFGGFINSLRNSLCIDVSKNNFKIGMQQVVDNIISSDRPSSESNIRED